MQPLEDIQREFFSALRMPLRGTSRRSTRLPPSGDGHSAEFLSKAEELMKPGANLSSAERLELYHRQYWFRVLDSVAEDFPVLRQMAGEEKFWELIEGYLEAFPSGSFTLRHLGRSMAAYLARAETLDETRRRWFSALAELEYAGMETFEAAEREPLAPEKLANEEIELQPYVRLLALPVPADLCTRWETFAPGEDTPIWLAVWRGPQGTHVTRLGAAEFELLCRLREGGHLDTLLATEVAPEPSPEDVQRWFSEWQSRGWITSRGSAVVELAARAGEDWSGVDKMGSQAVAMED